MRQVAGFVCGAWMAVAGGGASGWAQQAPASGAAPTPASPVTEVQRSYAGLKTNILKAAAKMPPEAYSFKPIPEVRTFARVVNHVIEAQTRSCGALNGTAAEALAKAPAETADKATIVAALEASFAECDKAYAGLSQGTLLQVVAMGESTRTRVTLAWGTVSHDNEQYATMALYLRLNGLVPPSSEK